MAKWMRGGDTPSLLSVRPRAPLHPACSRDAGGGAESRPGEVADTGTSAVLGTGPGVRGSWVPRTVLVYPAYHAARVAEEEAFAERLRRSGHPCTAFGIACLDGW